MGGVPLGSHDDMQIAFQAIPFKDQKKSVRFEA